MFYYVSKILLIGILDNFLENLVSKFFKKSKKPYSGAILGLFCPYLGKNEFSCKKVLCQFLNIPIV